jgi:hypothetical protein
MGGSCSTYGGYERCIQSFGGGPEGKKNLEDLGVEGMIILKLILKKWEREARTALL